MFVDTINTVAIANPTSGINYGWGAVAANGQMYFPPMCANRVLKFAPATNATLQIGGTYSPITNSAAFAQAVLAPNGNIYCAPYTQSQVLEINPFTDTTALVGPVIPSSGNYRFSGACLAKNGLIYFSPHDYDATTVKIGVFNPITKTMVYLYPTLPAKTTVAGIIEGTNGKLYMITRINEVIGVYNGLCVVIDVDNNNAMTTFATADILAMNRLSYPVRGPNGKLYFSNQSKFILELDTDTHTTRQIEFPEIAGYLALTPSGHILTTGDLVTKSLCLYDVFTDEILKVTYPSTSMSYITFITLAPNGCLYCPPATPAVAKMLKIETFPKATDFQKYIPSGKII